MTTISWLHLTDLHRGMEGQERLLANVETDLFSDLGRLHERCGPFDLILFTGDLTQEGTKAQYALLDETLGRLYGRLRELGSDPVLLAIPGNHDLQRPSGKKWREKAQQWELFREEGSFLQTITQAFQEYVAWWERQPYPKPTLLRRGMLPGDFGATLEKQGVRLGIVGLNSAFLQLSGGEYQTLLALDIDQFHRACGGNGPDWVKEHDLCFLLTHHPPAWLSAAAMKEFYAEVAVPGRFAVHLFGHMHEHSSTAVSRGDAKLVREWQGVSFFGLEREERRHGYAVGRLEFDLSRGEARLRRFPRVAARMEAGPLHLVADPGANLLEDGGSAPTTIALPRRDAVSQVGRAWTPQPSGPYHPDWYIRRGRKEHTALGALAHPKAVVVLVGPPLHGKTTFLRHILDQVRQQDRHTCILEVDLQRYDETSLASLERFLVQLANDIVAAAGGPPEWVDRVWSGRGSPVSRIGRLLEQSVLSPSDGRVLLCFEGLARLERRLYQHEFFGMLRSWAEDQGAAFQSLRMILVASAIPDPAFDRSNLFDIATRIRIGDFEEDEHVVRLARLYRLPWSEAELRTLTSKIGRHPHLLRLIMYPAALHGLGAEAALRESLGPEGDLRQWLQQRLDGLSAELRAALHRVMADPGARLDREVEAQLIQGGILRRAGDGLHLCYEIYADHLRSP